MNDKGFDLKGFKWAWEDGNEAAKLDLVDQASQLSPARGIIPVLAGIDSFHFFRSKSGKVES